MAGTKASCGGNGDRRFGDGRVLKKAGAIQVAPATSRIRQPMSADNMQLPVPNQAAMQQHVEHLFLDSVHGLVELAWTDVDDGAPKHAATVRAGSSRRIGGEGGASQRREAEMSILALRCGGRTRHLLAAPTAFTSSRPPRSGSTSMTLVRPCAPPRYISASASCLLCVVVTGGTPHQRAQCWWKLRRGHSRSSALVKTLLGSVQFALGGDPAVVDASRIMRLSGSVAWPVKTAVLN